MKENKVILGEFEDENYAEIAKRDLITAGIKANVRKEIMDNSTLYSQWTERVKIFVPTTQLEEARKVMTTRFVAFTQ